MFKLKAIKSENICVVVAFNDYMQECHFMDIEDAKGFVTHISWVLSEKGNSFWIKSTYGIEKLEKAKEIYSITFKVADTFVKSYILNKRKLTEFKNSLMGVLNG